MENRFRKLSVVIPVYNEEETIKAILKRVMEIDLPLLKEVIVVDDFSSDGTRQILESLGMDGVKVFFHDSNRGKGASLRTGFTHVSGDVVIIQDADLEYDPRDYSRLLSPILSGRADVVYGSRFNSYEARVLFFWHMLGNKFLTLLSNMLSNINLTDMETCYKAFKSSVLEKIEIEEDRFGFEPEFTAKAAKLKLRIYEVPISYAGRTYQEGKKITWKDGIRALWCIFKYNIFR